MTKSLQIVMHDDITRAPSIAVDGGLEHVLTFPLRCFQHHVRTLRASKDQSVLNVLIVEDDLAVADMLQEAPEAAGYSVSGIARTAKDALRLAENDNPDLAVVDLRLANGDLGSEVGERLRESTNAGIMFSTGNNSGIPLTTTHGDAVMTKPYSLGDVGRGLEIIRQIRESGKTDLPLPYRFKLLEAAIS